MTKTIALAALISLVAAPVLAGPEDFGPGPLIKGFGNIAPVPDAEAIPADMQIKMAYDVTQGGINGEVNGTFNSVAGLMNTLVANGVEKERINLALVVHGQAYKDLLTNKAYGGSNPNAALLEQLMDNGVRVYYCGQAAVARDVATEDLLPGVKLSLSASAAHAVLQMEGYAVRPY